MDILQAYGNTECRVLTTDILQMVTFHDLIVCSQVYVGPKNTVQYNIRADQTLDPSACDNSIVRVIGFAFPIARFKSRPP
jgi:hypothetical protein